MQKHVAADGALKPAFFSRAARQGRNYSTLVVWLMVSVFRGRTKKLATAIVLSLVHLGSQVAAIYAVYWYARQMEKTGIVTVPLLHFQLNLKDQPEWLWAIVIFSTACFVISAAFLYLSRQQLLNLVEKRYARSIEELVLLSTRLPDPRVRIASNLIMDYGVGGLTTGCRRGALTAIGFANAITAVIGGTGAAFFLFRIDLPLTLLIFVSASLAALFLYPLTLRAVQGAKDRERAHTAFKREVRQLADNPTASQTITSMETADEMARAYMMRRRVLTELVFAIEIGITAILALVVYYMASQALAGREQWAIFIAYIGALRMTLQGASQAIRAFANVSRYYPQIVRYYLFAKDMQRIDASSFTKVQRGEKVILGTLSNGDDVVVAVGDCVALLAGFGMREPQFALLNARLPHAAANLGMIVVDPANVSANDAALALVPANRLDKDGHQFRALLDGPLKDKVTLPVYQNADKVGGFGETHVLTVAEGEMQRFAVLGTPEGDAALKEFALQAARLRMKRGGVDDDDDDDDDDM